MKPAAPDPRAPSLRTRCAPALEQALARAAASLDTQARTALRAFVRAQLAADGGFRGRSGDGDLYYTVFGLECARALEIDVPVEPIRRFVESRLDASLDFVHLTCLVRCIEILAPDGAPLACGAGLSERLARHACAEGGYHRHPARRRGSVYESFIGALAAESLREALPNPGGLGAILAGLGKASGGFVNSEGWGVASTPASAAALLLLHELGEPLPPKSVAWLLGQQRAGGGFAAAPLAPISDLLSTATALHALNRIGALQGVAIDRCLDFVTGCWDDSGGFHAHAFDRRPDCEYAFYGLLALGNLVAPGGI
ncbi:MAG TPA: prenyltransferase/squalene oxidase repeat-containing protein [Verrucomicrobiota bacterium]|nr:prenyltransferase/squalene oxidase repeat-containing protein [Verrucomicrobiota bacterium]HRZ36031.1 prenyltransferase/squalene oxidase repeat-containing protein [Candidatus Paceibacterota bacterium]